VISTFTSEERSIGAGAYKSAAASQTPSRGAEQLLSFKFGYELYCLTDLLIAGLALEPFIRRAPHGICKRSAEPIAAMFGNLRFWAAR